MTNEELAETVDETDGVYPAGFYCEVCGWCEDGEDDDWDDGGRRMTRQYTPQESAQIAAATIAGAAYCVLSDGYVVGFSPRRTGNETRADAAYSTSVAVRRW